MKTIIKKIEKEIENQLDVKNEKNDFTTTNIEAILKEVIMDEDIKEMVRQTLRLQGSTKCPYEPKLTRAKIRELLKLRPDLSFPILWPIPTKKNANFVSECLSLINENYSENSSEDEEYIPSNNNQEEDDEPTFSDNFIGLPANVEMSRNVSSRMELRCSNAAQCSSRKQEENIGQRTRSKLPLTDTPLEVIEQAFAPPDITSDMYESECDNQDWLDFIKGFVQPLDTKCSEPTDIDDDLDDDPEYNILADEETVDREELRKDRAVEVPRKEVNDLIAELLKDCDPINSIIADKKLAGDSFQSRHGNTVSAEDSENGATRSLATVAKSVDENFACRVQPKTVRPEAVIPVTAARRSLPTLLPPQRQLLNQQMQQHIQMTTMHFLQFHKNVIYHNYASLMKAMIYNIKNLSANDRNSAFFALNLDSALQLIRDWEKLHAHIPQPKFNVFRRASRTSSKEDERFSQDLMKIVSMSDVFLYPLLLPRVPFSSAIPLTAYSTSLTSSEEWLLATGLEEFFDYIKRTEKPKNEHVILKKAVTLICRYLLPCFTVKYLCNYIKKRRTETNNNHIKEFFESGKVTPLKHYVIPVHRNPLFKQPSNLLPDVWANYIKNNYMVVKMRG